jgi:hypothetical protein
VSSENPHYEEYALSYQKMITENLAHFDAMKEELLRLKQAAVDELNTARNEIANIKSNADQIAIAEFEKQFSLLKEELKQNLLSDLIKKLVLANQSDQDIISWLEVTSESILKVKLELGFKYFGERLARVFYSGEGRGGVIHFQLENKITNFHWEFGGGNSLALIFIPDETQWKDATGYELTERESILEFIANEIISDKANGCTYEIGYDILKIMKPV